MEDQNQRELLGRLDERTERIVKILEGNGQPGIVQRVSVLENNSAGVKAIVAFAGSSGVLGILSLLYHWFTKH